MALAINFKWILSSCREKYIIYLALMCNFLKSILPGGSHTGARNMRISPAYCKCSRLRTLWENKKPTILRPFLERNLSLCDNTIIIIIYTIVMASRECCLLLSDSCFGRPSGSWNRILRILPLKGSFSFYMGNIKTEKHIYKHQKIRGRRKCCDEPGRAVRDVFAG